MLQCDHSNESYWAALSAISAYYAVEDGCNFWVSGWNLKVWAFKKKLLNSTFTVALSVIRLNKVVLISPVNEILKYDQSNESCETVISSWYCIYHDARCEILSCLFIWKPLSDTLWSLYLCFYLQFALQTEMWVFFWLKIFVTYLWRRSETSQTKWDTNKSFEKLFITHHHTARLSKAILNNFDF